MRLREPEVGERSQCRIDRVRRIVRYPVGRHPRVEALFERGHPEVRALRRHRLAQLISIGGAEATDRHRHLHELLLEERDAERPLQDRLEQRVEIGHRLLPSTTSDVGVDRVALDRTRADQRHLDHEVVEAPWLDARQRAHLRSRLDLEDAHGVRRTEQVVDRRLLGKITEIDRDSLMLADKVHHPMERLEHPEAEQIELDQTDRCAIVLVPLEHAATGHTAPLDRTHLDDRSIAQHHPRRVDPEMAWSMQHLACQTGHHRWQSLGNL